MPIQSQWDLLPETMGLQFERFRSGYSRLAEQL